MKLIKRWLKRRRDKQEERDVDKRLRALRRRQLQMAEHRQRLREIAELEEIDAIPAHDEEDYDDWDDDLDDPGSIEDVAMRNLLQHLFNADKAGVEAPRTGGAGGVQTAQLVELSDEEVAKIVQTNKKYLKSARHLDDGTIEKLIRANMPNLGHDTITRAIQQIRRL